MSPSSDFATMNTSSTAPDEAQRQRLDNAKQILVIKLGALGDMIIALGPFRAIRERHPNARISLLTTAPYAEIGRRCGLFDEVLIDTRPGWHEISGWLRVRRMLRDGHYDVVYDLQNNDRTSIYFQLFWPSPPPLWCGAALRAAFYFEDPQPPIRHAFDRHRSQLELVGINQLPLPDVSWMATNTEAFDLPERFALIVPGSAPHRPEKRWPVPNYIALCNQLLETGITPVLLGTASEGIITRDIVSACPKVHDLTGKTGLFDLASIGRQAVIAIGNDTGPMHLIGAAGTPSLVLFSGASSPHLSAPIGPQVKTMQEASLDRLTPERVWEAVESLLELTAS